MRGPVPSYPIELEAEQKISLSKISRSTSAAHAEVMRARILVTASQYPAYSNQQIAKEVGCAVSTVRKWRKRWGTTKKLSDAPRSGAPRRFSP